MDLELLKWLGSAIGGAITGVIGAVAAVAGSKAKRQSDTFTRLLREIEGYIAALKDERDRNKRLEAENDALRAENDANDTRWRLRVREVQREADEVRANCDLFRRHMTADYEVLRRALVGEIERGAVEEHEVLLAAHHHTPAAGIPAVPAPRQEA